MQVFALIAIFYFFAGASVCLLICVNPNDPGVLGTARRFFFNRVPDAFSAFVRRFFGDRVLGYLGRIKHYLSQTNHPIVQWFYYLIAVGGFTVYTFNGIFKHMPNKYVSEYNVILAYVMAGFCFWVYYKACSVSPGEVGPQSAPEYIQQFQTYYDGVLYKQKNQCTTCKVTKPARSKHCNICKMCVAKFDHHCIWIRQCVGQRNYKYFVTFLFSHSIWCSYLAVIGSVSLYESLIKMNFWQLSFRSGNQIIKADNWLALQYLFVMETMFFFIIIMCAIMGITLFIFVSYHFYLIAQNQTTNQRVKKNDYIDYLRKQKKSMKKFVDSTPNLPDKVEYNKQKMSRKDFLAYQEDVSWRLSVLERDVPNPGFFSNLKTIFSYPDK